VWSDEPSPQTAGTSTRNEQWIQRTVSDVWICAFRVTVFLRL